MNRRPILTLCGIHPRAWVESREGNRLTYVWPCGYRRTEVLTVGRGRLKKPAGESAAIFMARYWRKGQGVTYECPSCHRKAQISMARWEMSASNDGADVPVTPAEIDLIFRALFDMAPRQADLAVVRLTGGTRGALAEYVWDHWMGEPDDPSEDTILRGISAALDQARPRECARCGKVHLTDEERADCSRGEDG